MKLNIDSLLAIKDFLQKDYFYEKDYKRLIKTKGMKGFLEYENTLGRDINIKEELEKLVYIKDYKDKYGFYIAKKRLRELEDDIDYIKRYESYILAEAIKNVYKIIPNDMKINCKIYLFIGGNDGGFTVNRNKIYINYGKYINNMEEFIKVLSHELYHSRDISLRIRLLSLFKMLCSNNGRTYQIIGKIMEEGMASLTQHGAILKNNDPAGTLNSRDLLLIKYEFELLNKILLDIKNKNSYYKGLKQINLYAIGYYIVSTIYNTEGVLILDNWTVELKYEDIIKKYSEICNTREISSGFNKNILNLIINSNN